ncbi:unnamed protein product [Rotaria magnacalcarata]|uniref:TOG domain-containing protein n=1 Tax=Rotaria magnacalcarata TaxID=392030 RepID=A0A816SY96_9BILA|nr:unnamed protein product [Rotaria magnacalcarata]
MAGTSSTSQHKYLDDFYQSVLSKEPAVRLECFPSLENYLSDVNTSLECGDLTGFIDGLYRWIEGSNARIAGNGLRILELFLDRLDSNEFASYLDKVVSITVDRLGDAKDQVRETASNLLMKLMVTYAPQRIWDLIQALSFDHKQYRVKDESQRLLIRSLNEFGSSTIQLNKLVPLICKLISDSNGTVRQQAMDTLVEIYRHVGEKVRSDIAKRDIPEAKLKQLYEKFDDVLASGRMITKAADSTDDARAQSAAKSRRGSDSSTVSSCSRLSGSISTRTTTTSLSSAAAASGAVDEAIFEDAFNSSVDIMFSSGKDVENQLLNIRDTLADTNNDWEKRVDALKRLRSLVSSGGDQYDEFFRNLRQLDLPLATTVRDLRSQIVREACITLAYMSVRLTNRFERTAEGVIPVMINLLQNSAKIIATSGSVGMRYIVTNTQSSKLAPLILAGIESKSKEIRRQTYELLVIMLSNWDFSFLEKHGQLIHNGIKKGLSDADAEARINARKAFGFFREHFPALAETLLASLDASKKKALLGEMSNASSTQSLASVGSSRMRTAKDAPPRQARTEISDKQNTPTNIARSSSANELAMRQKNATSKTLSSLNTSSSQPKTNRHELLPRSSKTTKTSSVTPTSSKIVSQSQPGSRSTSPHSYRSSHHLASSLRTPTNARSRIPTGSNGDSRISSRESSPGRPRSYGYRGPGSDYGGRVGSSLHGDSGDDASETSSICSERAYEDIPDVLRRISSNEWAERKEGLASLYHMIRSGRVLNPPELKLLTELLTKRFYDPNSQVFTAFLDVLPDFIIAYKRELNDWLYVLLTRLLIRLGSSDILDSVFKKLKQCLSIVNSSFDVHAQFVALIRFINDNSSAPSIKVKEILLRYFQQIIQHMEPVDITNNTDIRITLSKIINWSGEPKSVEMRKAAQAVILALHNLNRPEFNLMLMALPQNCQDVVAKVIRSANDMQSSTHSQLDNKYDFFQRSSLSGLTSPMTASMHSDVQSPSYASDMRILMENMQALNVNNHQEDLLINLASLKDKEHRSMIPVRPYMSKSYRSNSSQNKMTESSDSIYETPDRPAAINIALNLANTLTLPKEQRQHGLRCVLKFAKLNDPEIWDLAFSKTLNTLTQILDNTQDEVIFKVYSLRIIRELLIHRTNLFMNYIELTIFRILKAQSENENDIIRAAEQAAQAAAEYLPAECNVRVLKPIIEQAKYPMNQSAIAMLQKAIEFMNKEACLDLMSEMIPPLLSAWDAHSHNLTSGASSWDHETSSVRKAAVFCLVAIYMVVGDALRTHLHRLSPSKVKLLNVYISKAQQQTTSAINNPEKIAATNGTNHTTS